MAEERGMQGGEGQSDVARSGLVRWALPWLERIDHLLYLAVAVIFVGAAIAIIGNAVGQFVDEVDDSFPRAVVRMVNEALLVLIVLELLGTVRSYLATGTVSVRIFLYVGIISAIRRIVAIGGQTSVGEGLREVEFVDLMIDLGVNALVVLALATSLYLVGRQFPLGRASPAATAEAEAQRAAGLE
ncbi:MAG: phosphate-starvation-inducible PsiE family protein [Dehalococcoidia bacterium]